MLELCSLRQHTVEPVFGHTGYNRGFARFMRRGQAAADAEWALINMTHNLLKLVQFPQLLAVRCHLSDGPNRRLEQRRGHLARTPRSGPLRPVMQTPADNRPRYPARRRLDQPRGQTATACVARLLFVFRVPRDRTVRPVAAAGPGADNAGAIGRSVRPQLPRPGGENGAVVLAASPAEIGCSSKCQRGERPAGAAA